MTTQFVPTATNMVAIVRNIIDGYRMGPLRALAQEPVQNSVDAARGKVRVEYRLHRRRFSDGSDSYMLTVTDCNTSGLDGPALSFEEIQNRGNVLDKSENWAAFEGMGYTKTGQDALGSRGQGKAAFLYHSRLPDPGLSGRDRMMILYDTLLANGTYRLGVRYARPFDTVMAPPLDGQRARSIVSSSYTAEDGTEIELGLDPLTSVGTRIIIPHLSSEAVEAVHSGEMYRWLQRCWWRAVQTGLTIGIVDEQGKKDSVRVPPWWETEPWKRHKAGVKVYEAIDVGDDLKIKRIVLLYDESLKEPEIENATPQFWGVQLLRGQQWIETVECQDYIPKDKRPGFRGFVEFDKGTERVLRSAETSQHESFDRRSTGVKPLIRGIESAVKEFAEEQGWATQDSTRPAPGTERYAALEFLNFLSPNARGITDTERASSGSAQLEMDLEKTDSWECDLRLDFPDPKSARVNWGQELRNVEVEVRLDPQRDSEIATVSLELACLAEETAKSIASQELRLRDGHGVASFCDFQIITGRPTLRKLQCPQPGRYKLTAVVESKGTQVARSSRSFYVQEDPPTNGSNPYTLSISVENHTVPQPQRRINSGDTVGVQISVINRTVEAQTFALTASLGELLLADTLEVGTEGTPPGASSVRVAGVQTQIMINPDKPGSHVFVNLAPGRHDLRADLYLDGQVVAHANRTVYVDVDPIQPQEWPPFDIEQISGEGNHPRWRFQKSSQDVWVLQYSPSYPLYRALDATTRSNGTRLLGVSAFVVDVCAEGIIEWVMEPLDGGDSSRLDELVSGTPAGIGHDLWESYCERIQELAELRRNPADVDKYGQLVRDCAALSLRLFEERG